MDITQERQTSMEAQLSDLRVSLARLEERQALMAEMDRERNYQAWHGLQSQINSAHQRITSSYQGMAMGLKGWAKVALAVVLFLISYAITGDKGAALRTATMPLGGH